MNLSLGVRPRGVDQLVAPHGCADEHHIFQRPRSASPCDAAHLAPGYLRAETLELLFTPQRTADGAGTSYGIGWAISRDTLGHAVVGHTGGSVGGTTVLRLDRASKLVVAVVSNLSDARLSEAARDIALVWDRAVTGAAAR